VQKKPIKNVILLYSTRNFDMIWRKITDYSYTK